MADPPYPPAGAPASKRAMDLLLAVPLILFASPFLLFTAAALLLLQGRPVLFSQPRAGLRGRSFRMYKFRTMRAGEGPDGERLTIPGRILRALSIDELPQLFNVLRGEMSLVGPRALLVSYLDRYDGRQRRRLDVLPGITGWAQINGRNALTWERRFELDVWYVENRSLWLDLKILMRTAWTVLSLRGVRHGAHATMPEFLGKGQGGRTG